MKNIYLYKAGSKIPNDVIPVTPKNKKYLNKFGVDVEIEYKDNDTINIFPINKLNDYDKIFYLRNCYIHKDKMKKVYIFTYPRKFYEISKDICNKYNIEYNECNGFINYI